MNAYKKQMQEVLISLLEHGRDVEIPVYGYSMMPFFPPGTTVKVRRVHIGEVRLGDVVFFIGKKGLVLHRVMRKLNNGLVCKGDSLRENDPLVEIPMLMGVVVAYRRKKKWQMANRNQFRRFARLVLLFPAITGFLFGWTVRFYVKATHCAENRYDIKVEQ